MSESAWPLVLDALVASWRGLPGMRAPNVYGDGAPVFDTVETWTDDQEWLPAGCVVVGDHGPGDNPEPPGDGTQAIACFGRPAHQRIESGTIRCRIEVRSGDVDAKPLRDRAFALLDTVTASLRADASLGLVGPLRSCTAELVTLQPQCSLADPGLSFAIPIEVKYTAHL